MPQSIDNLEKFKGPKILVETYLNTVKDLSASYMNGISFCLAGLHGTGKTLTASNVLKKAALKNFTALYTNLYDIVSALTSASNEDKHNARKEITEIDFLVIDEFDIRHSANTETASDLFGRTLEYCIRTRRQNKLPTILISNSPNPLEMFNGLVKEGIQTLMHGIELVPVIGSDFRVNEKMSKM